jgi:hypothetical protein
VLDDLGDPDETDPDIDGDTVANAEESARGTDAENAESDAAGARDDVDNCPATANADQANRDGDACDACPGSAAGDTDADGVCDDVDDCADIADPQQEDHDGDATATATATASRTPPTTALAR